MTTTLEIWKKLDSLYLIKTLPSQLFLKARFFTFRMKDNQKLQDHIDEFNKLCLDLENINVRYDDGDKAVVLLHFLPRSYEHFVDILRHDREKLSLDDVIGALNSKDLRFKLDEKSSTGDVLVARYRNSKRDPKVKGKSRSKSRNGRNPVKCYYCHEDGHIKRNCPKRKKDLQDKNISNGGALVCEFRYDSSEACCVTQN